MARDRQKAVRHLARLESLKTPTLLAVAPSITGADADDSVGFAGSANEDVCSRSFGSSLELPSDKSARMPDSNWVAIGAQGVDFSSVRTIRRL
jgi:hypothetical protein